MLVQKSRWTTLVYFLVKNINTENINTVALTDKQLGAHDPKLQRRSRIFTTSQFFNQALVTNT